MKKDTIQILLAKRQAGTINDEELAQLATLTHRDETMAAAELRADGIIRTRRRLVTACAAIVVVAVGTVALFMPQREEAPQLAQHQPTAIQQVVPSEEVMPVELSAEPVQVAEVKHVRRKVTREKPVATDEPVVMCNSQCDADSVISDIWKFLSV